MRHACALLALLLFAIVSPAAADDLQPLWRALVDPVETALGLPLMRPDGTPATLYEISAEWHVVKGHTELTQHGGMAYGAVTKLRLTPEGIESVVLAKLTQVAAFLGQRFPEFEHWPWQAQMATLSMAWAAGPSFNAPRFSAAVKDWNWATYGKDSQDKPVLIGGCAKECHLDDSQNPGLRPRNAANRALFEAAALPPPTDTPANETALSDTLEGIAA